MSHRIGGALLYPLPFLAVIALWVLAKWALDVSDETIVSPAEVVRTAGELLDRGELPEYISQSLSRLAIGAVLATAIGVPIGLLLGANRHAATMFGPFLRFF